MSLLKSLFGGRDKAAGEAAAPAAKAIPVAKEVEHKGFLIQATPYKDAGQYQTCGTVSKVIDGVLKEQKFIRADRFASIDEAVDCSLSKGRQMIDEQGERLFQ